MLWHCGLVINWVGFSAACHSFVAAASAVVSGLWKLLLESSATSHLSTVHQRNVGCNPIKSKVAMISKLNAHAWTFGWSWIIRGEPHSVSVLIFIYIGLSRNQSSASNYYMLWAFLCDLGEETGWKWLPKFIVEAYWQNHLRHVLHSWLNWIIMKYLSRAICGGKGNKTL